MVNNDKIGAGRFRKYENSDLAGRARWAWMTLAFIAAGAGVIWVGFDESEGAQQAEQTREVWEPAGQTAVRGMAALPTSPAVESPSERPNGSTPGNDLLQSLRAPIDEAAGRDRALADLAAGIDLRALVAQPMIATPGGRTQSLQQLDRAEEVAHARLANAKRSMDLIRSAAVAAQVDARVKSDFVSQFDQFAGKSLALSQKLHTIQLQAISIARGLIAFMDENQSGYEVQDDKATFGSQALLVQFSHYLTRTSQVLQREAVVQREAAEVLQRQERTLLSLAAAR
jgi:hypothetical protein